MYPPAILMEDTIPIVCGHRQRSMRYIAPRGRLSLREALFTFGRLHPELRILSVPYVRSARFLRRFCTEDLKWTTAPWLSMLFSEDFGGNLEKYPCKVGLSSSICVRRSPVLDVFFCTFLRFFENYRFRRKRRFAPVPTRWI